MPARKTRPTKSLWVPVRSRVVPELGIPFDAIWAWRRNGNYCPPLGRKVRFHMKRNPNRGRGITNKKILHLHIDDYQALRNLSDDPDWIRFVDVPPDAASRSQLGEWHRKGLCPPLGRKLNSEKRRGRLCLHRDEISALRAARNAPWTPIEQAAHEIPMAASTLRTWHYELDNWSPALGRTVQMELRYAHDAAGLWTPLLCLHDDDKDAIKKERESRSNNSVDNSPWLYIGEAAARTGYHISRFYHWEEDKWCTPLEKKARFKWTTKKSKARDYRQLFIHEKDVEEIERRLAENQPPFPKSGTARQISKSVEHPVEFVRNSLRCAREDGTLVEGLHFWIPKSPIDLASGGKGKAIIYDLDLVIPWFEGSPAKVDESRDVESPDQESKGWWFDHEPPEDRRFFGHGYVEGTMKDLSRAIGRNNKTLKDNNGDGGWWIMKVTGQCYRAWFSSQQYFANVNAKMKKLASQ